MGFHLHLSQQRISRKYVKTGFKSETVITFSDLNPKWLCFFR
jgi:hypothetical protein